MVETVDLRLRLCCELVVVISWEVGDENEDSREVTAVDAQPDDHRRRTSTVTDDLFLTRGLFLALAHFLF